MSSIINSTLNKIKRGNANKDDLLTLLELLPLLDDDSRKSISYIAARYSVQRFPDIFWVFARELEGTVWYFKLLGEAIYLSSDKKELWNEFYNEAIRSLTTISPAYRGLGLIFLANYIYYVDKDLSLKLLISAINNIDTSIAGVVGGIILYSIRLAGKLERADIAKLILVKILDNGQLTLFEKVDLLSEIAIAFKKGEVVEKAMREAVVYANRIRDDELYKMAAVIIHNTSTQLEDITLLEDLRKISGGLIRKAVDDAIKKLKLKEHAKIEIV